MQICECAGGSAPNPHAVQGSTVHTHTHRLIRTKASLETTQLCSDTDFKIPLELQQPRLGRAGREVTKGPRGTGHRAWEQNHPCNF